MVDSRSTDFYCLGRFVNFVSGEKSPYQRLLLEVMYSNGELPLGKTELNLSKSLRRMMSGYLAPNDWVHLVGKGKLDARSNQMLWQAREIVTLSVAQAEARMQVYSTRILGEGQLAAGQPIADLSIAEKSVADKPNPMRILICQKSACQQRGALAVSKAVEAALTEAGCAQQMMVKATGCLKQCKFGPNLVFLPGGDRHSQMTPTAARSLIQKRLQTARALL